MEEMTRLEFERIYKAYYSRLCAYAYRLVHNYEEARELVVDVFMDIWERKVSLDSEERAKAYLFRAVLYQASNCLNRRDVRRRYMDEALKTETVMENSVDRIVAYKELYGELDKAVDKLPERCREVFELSRFSGMSNGQIAEELKISVKTVEAQMTKALSRIKGHLAGKGVELVGLLLAGKVIQEIGHELFFNFF
ncbi:DNA-directed RNA polymerase sigma-70 factor [Fulvitalea axinellae]|uniref:DNA-directed RNA polymerase sigma-70 factor n=1 Tax=Fulvitalea axinellae TaxID=1182444 RepID=A0AAU9D6N2_9BACT|nr:DNA-directed RNA polymerase sigma-70 factor [Fulvitalea axinellae]